MNGSQVACTFEIKSSVPCWKNRAVALRERFVYFQLTLGNKISFERAFALNAQSQQSQWNKLRLITPHWIFWKSISSFFDVYTLIAAGTCSHHIFVRFYFNNPQYFFIFRMSKIEFYLRLFFFFYCALNYFITQNGNSEIAFDTMASRKNKTHELQEKNTNIPSGIYILMEFYMNFEAHMSLGCQHKMIVTTLQISNKQHSSQTDTHRLNTW